MTVAVAGYPTWSSGISGTEEVSHGRAPIAAQHLWSKFSRTLIAAAGFSPASAEAIVTFGGAAEVGCTAVPRLPNIDRLGSSFSIGHPIRAMTYHVHVFFIWSLLAIISLHVTAALFHHLVFRDTWSEQFQSLDSAPDRYRIHTRPRIRDLTD
ncbi:hypothetical protein QA640_32560 [Bradyrhizobium sp. CB82]|uniref:hypothetical protein n=1 Tax=Bradyrhizobium sp. CB82 TaxID=3039159 RepID=UPI0024B0C722|nr:hypothetical protein [Bradyrhizobium sp. CB82]WFU39090.1 hypothetical protein QA640_32560 [Bradyrhizobium sp. CB82]